MLIRNLHSSKAVAVDEILPEMDKVGVDGRKLLRNRILALFSLFPSLLNHL